MSDVYGPPALLANLEEQAVTESSGIVASRHNPDLFWTHNDSGDGPFLYAFDRRGRARGVWRVTGAKARDWEDIAAGPGPTKGLSYLYIGDIGDNSRKREEITVYRVAEPVIESSGTRSSKAAPLPTAAAEAIRLRYPDGRHDAEALMIHPQTGDLYLITKYATEAKVYKAQAPLDSTTITTLKAISDLQVPSLFGGMITGADISPDGRKLALCDYFNAYEMSLPAAASEFDRIWQQPLSTIPLGARSQGEAVCYRLDGKTLLATSEQKPTPLVEVQRKE